MPTAFAANSCKTAPTDKLVSLFDDIGQQPLAWLSERSIYQALAERGLSIFDKSQKPYRDIQTQWQPIIDMLAHEPVGTNSPNQSGNQAAVTPFPNNPPDNQNNQNKQLVRVTILMGTWIAIGIGIFIIGSIMGLKPSARETMRDNLRMAARRLDIQPRLVACPNWIMGEGGERGKGMIAQYVLSLKRRVCRLATSILV